MDARAHADAEGTDWREDRVGLGPQDDERSNREQVSRNRGDSAGWVDVSGESPDLAGSEGPERALLAEQKA